MTQLQKKEIDIEDIQEENLPLKTEEIISILNKTTNSKFLKSDEIIANIALNFKKFSLEEIAKKNEVKIEPDNNSVEAREKNTGEILKQSQEIEDKEKSDEAIIEEKVPEKIYTKEEADKIANELAKTYYQNGFNAGVNNLKKELQGGEQAIAMALKNTIDSLFFVSSEFIEKLNLDLNKTIMEICNSIVGYEIDKVPENFIKKINSLVESIQSSSNNIKVILNKDDHVSINDYLKKNKPLVDLKLEIDEKLQRGDLVLKSGGIEINDIVCEKIHLVSNSDIENEIAVLNNENNSIKSSIKNSSSKVAEIIPEKLKINPSSNETEIKNSRANTKENISKNSTVDKDSINITGKE
jgi:flagellar biosynthesis/type III secretory pathway protein FliH